MFSLSPVLSRSVTQSSPGSSTQLGNTAESNSTRLATKGSKKKPLLLVTSCWQSCFLLVYPCTTPKVSNFERLGSICPSLSNLSMTPSLLTLDNLEDDRSRKSDFSQVYIYYNGKDHIIKSLPTFLGDHVYIIFFWDLGELSCTHEKKCYRVKQ